MRVAQFSEFGGPDMLRIEEVPDPVAGDGEIVIRVSAVGLNFFDTLVLRNKYQVPPTLPHSPGAEVAGTIESIGPDVSNLELGQRVVAFIGGNGCREKVATTAGNAVPIPDGVSEAEAAGIPVTYGTALHALKDRGQLMPGETIAVLGAAGGAGLAAVELAKIMGGRVIAVASSAGKLELAHAHGAEAGINYQDEDLKARLKEMTGGKGVDVIYDCVGGPHAEPALRATAWEGRYLVVGFAAGEIPRIPLNLILLKGCSLIGVFWTAFVERHPDRHRANMAELLAWCREGLIKPHIHASFPLVETAEALRLIEGRKVTGKVIVNPQL
ncbi:MAG: NADPH:quinone oxidoreductase family protein [Methyloceanibacter sp.]